MSKHSDTCPFCTDDSAFCPSEDRARAEKAEAQVRKLDLAVRVALAFTRPGVEGAMHLLEVERVEMASDLVGYLRAALAEAKR